LPSTRDRHVTWIGGGPSKLLQRRTSNAVLLPDAFGGQSTLTNEPPNRLDMEVLMVATGVGTGRPHG
jgi:hypothetical protein